MHIEWGTVASTDEPVSVASFKEHARTASSTEDTYIGYLLTAAREYVEREVSGGLLLAPRSGTLKMHKFPAGNGTIRLPAPVPNSSDVNVGYFDTSGSTQSLTRDTDYMTITPTRGPATVYPITDWPDVHELDSGHFRPDAVEVAFVAGSTAVDEMAKQAIRLIASDWYERREETCETVSPSIENGLKRMGGR